MKIILTSIFALLFLASFAQLTPKRQTPIQIINRNFKVYISDDDNSPSWKTRKDMMDALIKLQQTVKTQDFTLLVNVWMYYDPSDFPTRSLIEPIFDKHKTAALSAINKRLVHKKEEETKEDAPYSELIELQRELSK